MKRSLSMLVFAFVATVLCVVTLTPPDPAHAVLITLEPDDYAVGTNVTNLFEGVTLQRYSGGGGTSISMTDVSIQDWSTMAATGTRTFGLYNGAIEAASCWSNWSCSQYFSALAMQFTTPTNYLEVSATFSADAPYLVAFGMDGSMLPWGTVTTVISSNYSSYGVPYGNSVLMRIGGLDQSPLIQTVLFGGALGNMNVDRIVYNQVPEPSALLLLASGLGMALAVRWIHGWGAA